MFFFTHNNIYLHIFAPILYEQFDDDFEITDMIKRNTILWFIGLASGVMYILWICIKIIYNIHNEDDDDDIWMIYASMIIASCHVFITGTCHFLSFNPGKHIYNKLGNLPGFICNKLNNKLDDLCTCNRSSFMQLFDDNYADQNEDAYM